MATGTSTSSQIPAPVQEFYDRALLERAVPNLVHGVFGQQRLVKMNSGEQPKFRRYSSLPKANQPLTEGVTPSAQQLAKTDILGQLEQYGAYVEISDYVQYTSQDSILAETAEILGENAGESVDLVYRDTLVAGTSVFYAGAVAGRTSIVTGQTVNDYKKIVRALQNSNAKPYKTNPIIGSDKVGTTPVWSSYFAIIDPEAYYDLQALTGFQQVADYPDGGKSAIMHEVGTLNHVRFVMTSEAKVWADAGGAVGSTGLATTSASLIDVHTALIFGMNAYGVCPLQGKALENIVRPVGSGDDPLEQRSTSGWKATTDIVILNETFMYRYEFGVSA